MEKEQVTTSDPAIEHTHTKCTPSKLCVSVVCVCVVCVCVCAYLLVF